MSWVKENKFLAGFTAATVVGAGALGFLVFQAKSAYSDATTKYEEQSTELTRLQGAQPFPSAPNVKKLEEQRKQYQDAVGELQQKLAKLELPVEQISPAQFQDRLRQSLDAITKRASEAGVALTVENFALGFQRYLAEPPRPEAAPLLGRQLKAIEAVVATVIDSKVDSLTGLERDELPEEKSGTREPEPTKPGAKGSKATKELVDRQSFTIKFVSNQGGIMKVLNTIVASNTQFYVPRLITIENQTTGGPARMAQSMPVAAPSIDPATGQPVVAAAAAPGNSALGVPQAPAAHLAGQSASPYIVGEEKAEVTIRIEIIDFADKATTAK